MLDGSRPGPDADGRSGGPQGSGSGSRTEPTHRPRVDSPPESQEAHRLEGDQIDIGVEIGLHDVLLSHGRKFDGGNASMRGGDDHFIIVDKVLEKSLKSGTRLDSRVQSSGIHSEGGIGVKRYVDLSGKVENGLWGYEVLPGLENIIPAASIQAIASVRENGFFASKVCLSTITGTYLEAGSHILEGAKNLDAYGIADFIKTAAIVRLPRQRKKPWCTRSFWRSTPHAFPAGTH